MKKRTDKTWIAFLCASLLLLVGGLNISSMRARAAEPADSVTISLAGDCSLGKLSIHGYSGTFYEMYDLYGAS